MDRPFGQRCVPGLLLLGLGLAEATALWLCGTRDVLAVLAYAKGTYAYR